MTTLKEWIMKYFEPETSIQPFSFKYGKNDKIVHSVDVGATIEAYTQKIDIMATEENNQILISLFVSYLFGKAVSKRLKNIKKYSIE